MLQNTVRDGQQNFFLADRHSFDIFHFKWEHVDDQVDVAVQEVISQLGGIALHQL